MVPSPTYNELKLKVSELESIGELILQSEEKFRSLSENSPDYIMRYDKQFRHLYQNAAAYKVSGFTEEEFIGKTHKELGFNSELSNMWEDKIDHVFKTGKPSGEIFEWESADGMVYLDWRLSPEFDKDRNVNTVLAVSRDITEIKQLEKSLLQSESRFRKYFELGLVGMATTSVEKGWLDYNDTICKIFGYSREEFIELTWEEMTHPDDIKDDKIQFNRVISCEINGYSKEKRYIHKDGSTIYAQLSVNAVHTTAGTVDYLVAIIVDITERKLAEDELQKARKLESIGLLAGGIAHDFNNILTGLFGNIEMAKRKLTPDHTAYTYIKNADQALEKATNLTKQLLTFAKGGDPLLEMVSIGQIIQDSITFSLSGSNVKTIVNLPDALWQVKADKGQLSQVITNLTINANQAMPTGGTLTIEAENIKGVDNNFTPNLSEDIVKLSISDDGHGISAEHLKSIFDPYFTTKQAGSGLGLTTANSIISKHNGHIAVVSELGVGTTFTIYLPADRLTTDTTEIAADMTEKSDPMSGNILVMDDDEMIRILSTDIIETFGYTVDTAVDGNEAIDKYLSAKKNGKAFDVVIMDLTIPGGMGGKDAMKELLALDPEVKAIVSSGYSTDPVMANYREYGFKGMLTKPFQMDELQKELSLLTAL